MLIKCEIPGGLSGVVSAAGPIDCAPGAAHQARRAFPAGFSRTAGTWKQALGSLAVLGLALGGLVLLAEEAMHGGALLALRASLGWA